MPPFSERAEDWGQGRDPTQWERHCQVRLDSCFPVESRTLQGGHCSVLWEPPEPSFSTTIAVPLDNRKGHLGPRELCSLLHTPLRLVSLAGRVWTVLFGTFSMFQRFSRIWAHTCKLPQLVCFHVIPVPYLEQTTCPLLRSHFSAGERDRKWRAAI